MGKSAPAPPDPVRTANAQAGANLNTALTQQQLNMVDQVNPWGTVSYTQNGQNFTPGTGIGTSEYYYNPASGEYRTSAPMSSGPVAGTETAGTPIRTGIGGMLGLTTGGTPAQQGGLEEGWERVQGNLLPRYTQTTALSPEQQAIFDQSQDAQANLAGLAADQSGMLRGYLSSPFEFTNRDAEQWAFDLASPRILQQQGRNDAQLRTILANKGIREGSAAWNAEMARMTNANTDQLNQLALTGRGQAFSEALAQRNQPINEITALLSGSQVSNPATMSGATPQTSVGGVDYSGLVQNNYQQQLNAYNSRMGGIGGLFGSVLGAAGQAGGFGALLSDRRLKTDIRRVGQTDAGVPIYTYRYVMGGPVQMGVMAQDVPDAAVMHESGYLMVDYSEVR